MVGERAAANTLDYVYIATDQTHVRELGALLMAREAVRQLNEQGILTAYSRSVGPHLMLDASNIAFGGLYVGNTSSKSFRITPFGDVTGTIDIGAAPGYDLSLDGVEFASATPSSSPVKVWTVSTGPNTSRWTISLSFERGITSVGS